jgi:predicted porin
LLLPFICNASNANKPELYGRLWVAVTQSQNELTGYNPQNNVHLENYLSFFGIRGEQKVSDELSFIYQLEQGVNSLNDYSDKIFTPRNSFLGIKSEYGIILFGRKDSIFKDVKGKTDIFEITPNDMAALFGANDRYADSIVYQTPSYHNTVFKFSTITSSEDDIAFPYSFVLSIGDQNFKSNNYYISSGYIHRINNYTGTRSALGIKLSDAIFGFQYQYLNSDKYHRGGDSYLASLRYSFGKTDLKLQYIYDNSGLGSIYQNASGTADSLSGTKGTQSVVGFEYHIASNITFMGDVAAYEGEYVLDSVRRKFNDLLSSVALRLYF